MCGCVRGMTTQVTSSQRQMRTLQLLALLPLASAFVTPGLSRVNRVMKMQSARPEDIVLDEKLAEKEVAKAGVSAPLGFFDPLGFYKDKTVRQKKKLREAELKHGRVAMLAVLGIVVQEFWHPLLGNEEMGPAVTHFNQVADVLPDSWAIFLLAVSLGEAKSILKGWDPIEETFERPKIAGLREGYVAGALDFDPLSFCPDEEGAFLDMRTKELNNGRLAMIGAAGIMAQEAVTHQAIFGGGSS